MATVPMNPTDATLWEIERDPTLRTPIVAVMTLHRECNFDDVVTRVEAATLLFPRLRQIVVEPTAGLGVPHWADDDDFDVHYHVRHIRIPSPADLAAVLTMAGPIASGDFDRKRPLWELTYVSGLQDGTAAVVMKVHHALTDGIGGVELLDALLDYRPDAEVRQPLPSMSETPANDRTGLTQLVSRTIGFEARAAREAVHAALRPDQTARRGWAALRSTQKMLAPARAPLSPLWTSRGKDRALTTTEFDLGRMRAAARRVGCTINDVFIAGAVQGIEAYHRAAGEPVERLRFTMPVNLRTADDRRGGNQWAPARFVLPTTIADPVERMRHIHNVVSSWRREPAMGFNHVLAGLIQQLPGSLSSGVVSQMMRGVDVVVTDVPGLREPRWFVGAEVTRLYAFAPTGGAATNIALLSHLDRACFGIVTDVRAVGDPHLLTELLADGIEATIVAAETADPTPPPTATASDTASTGGAESGEHVERLSTLDTGFIRAESPETPMHIGAVLRLEPAGITTDDGTLRLNDIRRHIDARLDRVPRFRRRLVEVPIHYGRPLWVDDPQFDIARHVMEIALPAPGSEEQLQELITSLYAELLEHDKPLWELWFVTGLADGSVALVEKIHHALIDGISGVELAAAIFDPAPTSSIGVPAPRSVPPIPNAVQLFLGAVGEQLSDPARLAIANARAIGRPTELWRQARVIGSATSEFVGRAQAPTVSLNRPVGRRRRLVSLTFSRAELEEIRRELGGSLNDVVLTMVSGGLRALEGARHEPVNDLRTLVPVSTRHAGTDREPGNRVGFVLVELPIAEPSAQRRLEMVSARMRRCKERQEALGFEALVSALDHLPGQFAEAARLVHRQAYANLVVTNVPGPPTPLYLLESRIVSMVPVVPLTGNVDLAVAVLTYAGQVVIAFHADPDRCPDLDIATDGVNDALAELRIVADRVKSVHSATGS